MYLGKTFQGKVISCTEPWKHFQTCHRHSTLWDSTESINITCYYMSYLQLLSFILEAGLNFKAILSSQVGRQGKKYAVLRHSSVRWLKTFLNHRCRHNIPCYIFYLIYIYHFMGNTFCQFWVYNMDILVDLLLQTYRPCNEWYHNRGGWHGLIMESDYLFHHADNKEKGPHWFPDTQILEGNDRVTIRASVYSFSN